MFPWQDKYNAAVLETDPRMMRSRIDAAHEAIHERIIVLSKDHMGTPEERKEISDALNALARLREEWR